MRSYNFAYLKKINPVYYRLLCEIEYSTYLNPKEAAMKCRHLLELIVNSYDKDMRYLEEDLHTKIRGLRQEGYLPTLRGVDGRFLVYGSELRTIRKKIPGYDYLRKVGNAGAHSGNYSIGSNAEEVELSTETIFQALSTLHELLQLVYADKLKKKHIKDFNRSDVPIGLYFLDESRNALDTASTHCLKEHSVHRFLSDNTERVIYGMIREYETGRSRFDSHDRVLDVYSTAYPYMAANGITNLHKLNEYDTPFTNLYIAYDFTGNLKPLRLYLSDNSENPSFDLESRFKLCMRIAQELKQFHTSDNPIYIRFLNYDSIMVAEGEESDCGIPHIVKFEFAKITEMNGTYLEYLLRAADEESMVKMRRYLDSGMISTSTKDWKEEWQKFDVFSLGVLFVDIVNGEVSKGDPRRSESVV